jgi:outer membrane protein assembly factor BamE (lipoprotein component of BamABCDE complex)
MKKALLVLLLMGLTAGCATAEKMNQVSVGMTKSEVIEVMGSPTSSSAQGSTEYMNYALYDTAEARRFGLYTRYFVRLVNGRVESYGRTGDFDSTQPKTQRIEIQSTVKTER